MIFLATSSLLMLLRANHPLEGPFSKISIFDYETVDGNLIGIKTNTFLLVWRKSCEDLNHG